MLVWGLWTIFICRWVSHSSEVQRNGAFFWRWPADNSKSSSWKCDDKPCTQFAGLRVEPHWNISLDESSGLQCDTAAWDWLHYHLQTSCSVLCLSERYQADAVVPVQGLVQECLRVLGNRTLLSCSIKRCMMVEWRTAVYTRTKDN